MTIILLISAQDQGYKNYRVIRIHDGIKEVLDSIYDEYYHTLTFEIDRGSTYAISYDVGEDNRVWWLLLVLLVPLGYGGYRYHQVILDMIYYRLTWLLIRLIFTI